MTAGHKGGDYVSLMVMSRIAGGKGGGDVRMLVMSRIAGRKGRGGDVCMSVMSKVAGGKDGDNACRCLGSHAARRTSLGKFHGAERLSERCCSR